MSHIQKHVLFPLFPQPSACYLCASLETGDIIGSAVTQCATRPQCVKLPDICRTSLITQCAGVWLRHCVFADTLSLCMQRGTNWVFVVAIITAKIMPHLLFAKKREARS